jgi:hypothetical protein
MTSPLNQSPANKLRYISRRLRQLTNNPRYNHRRTISKNGVPYLKFDDFNVVYFGTDRVYKVFFGSEKPVVIGRVPKRYSTFEKRYVDIAIAELEQAYRRWMRGKRYRGSLALVSPWETYVAYSQPNV